MNTHIGDKIFQNTPRRVAKFRENRPRDIEKSVVGKKIKHGQNITVFAIAIAIAGDCKNCDPSKGRHGPSSPMIGLNTPLAKKTQTQRRAIVLQP